MIQRIQTLYLLGVAVLSTLMATLSMARFSTEVEKLSLKAFGVVQTAAAEDVVAAASEKYVETAGAGYLFGTPFLGAVIVLALAVAVVTIFLFKNRLLQIRLCAVEIVLQLGAQIFICFYIVRMMKAVAEFGAYDSRFTVVAVFPLVCMVLSYLALRAVVKDEAMVRSLDRIR